jgi:hypothetical protein
MAVTTAAGANEARRCDDVPCLLSGFPETVLVFQLSAAELLTPPDSLPNGPPPTAAVDRKPLPGLGIDKCCSEAALADVFEAQSQTAGRAHPQLVARRSSPWECDHPACEARDRGIGDRAGTGGDACSLCRLVSKQLCL